MRSAISVLVVLLTAPLARADDPAIRRPTSEAALAHLAHATKLYNLRAFDEAASEYKAGALVEPAPVFDYNLGQCYRQLGRNQDAIWHYERFVRSSPETPERNALVATFIAQLRAPPPNAAAPPIAAATRVATRAWYDDRAGWGLAGGGVIVMGAAAALLVSASDLEADASRTSLQSAALALRDRADTRMRIGAVVGAVGIGLALGGVIKLAIAPTPNGVTAVGRF